MAAVLWLAAVLTGCSAAEADVMEVRFEVTYADQSPGTATVETSLNGAWEREYLRDPITGLFQEAAEADVVTDGEALLKLGIGVEGLLRREVAHQYVGWPPESTTDGSVANLCRRISPDVIEAMGFTCLDFGPAVFPFRVVATRNAADGLTVVIAIGDTDPVTGAPPELRNPVLVPVRGDEGSVIDVELISGRWQGPVVWTEALRVTLNP